MPGITRNIGLSKVRQGTNKNPLVVVNDAYWAAKQSAILATQASNLFMFLPLTETAGTIAANVAPARPNINIISNPGFELSGDVTYPTAYLWGESLAGGTAARVTDIKHSGSAAVKLQSTGGYTLLNKTITIKEGISYTFKCWSRGDGTTSPKVRILRGDSGSYLVDANTGNITTDWVQYSVTFTPPVGYSSRIYLQIMTRNVSGAIAYFDDCELYSNTAFSDVFNVSMVNPMLSYDSGEGHSLYFDGNGVVKLSSAAICNSFNAISPAGSMLIFAKMSQAVLDDAVIRYLIKFKTIGESSANYIDCYKQATSKQVGWQFQDDGAQGHVKNTAGVADKWFCIGARWSVANGISFSVNGVEYSSGNAITGNWTKPFDFSILALGSSTSSGYDNNWKGSLIHFAIWDKELTQAEMLAIGKIY